MYDIANSIKFNDICSVLEKIKNASATDKEKYIRRYYKSFQKHRQTFRLENRISLESNENGESSFYCVLRCLIPRSDHARSPYRLQINTLANVYKKVLQIPTDSKELRRLEGYIGRDGDYAESVYKVLLPRSQGTPSNLTIREVHEMLDSVAEGDIKNTEKVLVKLLEVASAQEQKWFIRLLLKSMHIGIGEQKIFGILHPKAKQLYRSCNNLSKVCCLLADNSFANDDGSNIPVSESIANNRYQNCPGTLSNFDLIEPFQSLQPMLCERFLGSIEALMATDVLYLETKMDGERFHIHYSNGEFKYFSRTGIDWTESFGAFLTTGSLTPLLEDSLPLSIQSFIIDGEMMIWDKNRKRLCEKSENTDVKNLKGRPNLRPCYIAYDLLYLDGHALLHKPFAQRMYKLKELFKEKQSVFQFVESLKLTSLEQYLNAFQRSLDANEEGVVLKQQTSLYKPGVRNGGGWYKVKADYIEGLTTDFDLLIIGGFYNQARTFIAAFLLGVLKFTTEDKFEVYSVGKVPNTHYHRISLNERLKPHWKNLEQEPPPMWYHFKPANPNGRPHVWIEPRNSTILQIKAADLNPSSAFYLAKSLHFPRVVAWRNDKLWNEGTSFQEYIQICQSNEPIRKIHKRDVRVADFVGNRRRLRDTPAQKRKLGLLVYEKNHLMDKVRKVSSLFEGLQFCIISDCPSQGHLSHNLKALVIENGGEIVENPIRNATCLIVAGDETFRVKVFVKGGQYDILTVKWLLKTCERQHMKIGPRDFLFITNKLQNQMQVMYDQYGDSYTDLVDHLELQDLLEDKALTEESNSLEILSLEMLELEGELYGSRTGPNYFRNTLSLFHGQDKHVQLAKFLFQWHGGSALETVGSDLTSLKNVYCIFINVESVNRVIFVEWVKKHYVNILKNLKIVNIDWIFHSDKVNRRLDVSEYVWYNF